MKEPKPKKIIRGNQWNQEEAHNEGEWPFKFGAWQMTFYPYLHSAEDKIIWLEPDISHIHAFTEQNVKYYPRLPEWDYQQGGYTQTEELPYCLLCGLFMEKADYESFMKSKELVYLAVRRAGGNVL